VLRDVVMDTRFRYEPRWPGEFLQAALAGGIESTYTRCVHNVLRCTVRLAAGRHLRLRDHRGAHGKAARTLSGLRARKEPAIPLDSGTGTPRRPRPAPAREAEASACTRYYAAKASETEMRNRVRAGELLEADEAEARWGGIVTAIRDAVLQLPGTLV
jgi:hypothetical protein